MLSWLVLSTVGLMLWFAIVGAAGGLGRSTRKVSWLDAARRESWDLGLPFPEADGTLSRSAPVTELPEPNRPTGEQVAAGLHARRYEAEAKYFLVTEMARYGLPPDIGWTMTKAELIARLMACRRVEAGPSSAAEWNATIRDDLAHTAGIGVESRVADWRRGDPDWDREYIAQQIQMFGIEGVHLGESD